jgi:hypothetical protein
MGRKKKAGRKRRRSGGSLSALRGAVKSAAGSKAPRKKTWKGRALDAFLWLAVIALAYFVIRSRCSR